MKKYLCEECGVILSWPEVVWIYDEEDVEHYVCCYCADEKYRCREQDCLYT